jgi:hypothetical protein
LATGGSLTRTSAYCTASSLEMVKQEQPDNLRRTTAAYLEVVLELVYVAVRVARGCDAAARLVRVVDQHPSAGVRMTKRDAREIERENMCTIQSERRPAKPRQARA